MTAAAIVSRASQQARRIRNERTRGRHEGASDSFQAPLLGTTLDAGLLLALEAVASILEEDLPSLPSLSPSTLPATLPQT